jgi:hypothetical protein
MESSRRGFLKVSLMVATITAIPQSVKTLARVAGRRFGDWLFGRPSLPSIQAAEMVHPSPASLARIQYRNQALARGIPEKTTLRWEYEQQEGGEHALPAWFDPRFSPSLRSILDDTVR